MPLMNIMIDELLRMDFSGAKKAADIYPIISIIGDVFSKREYESVDRFLANADIEQYSDLAKVAMVRTTFPARNKLKEWHSARDRVASLLDEPEKQLRGLYA